MVERLSLKHAVFGMFDGLTVVMGVILGLFSRHPALILPTALTVGAAEAIGMGAGEWLSANKTGLRGPLTIALSTLLGTVLPAIPFALLSASSAATLSAVSFLLAVLAITTARADDRGWVRSGVETVGIMLAVMGATWLISLL